MGILSVKNLLLTLVTIQSLTTNAERNSLRFKDLKIVCIGCSTGMGGSTVKYLSSNGAKVVACSRSIKKFDWISPDDLNESIFITTCDAADIQSFQNLLTFSLEKLNTITGLVYVPTFIPNEASVNRLKPFHKIHLNETLDWFDKQSNVDYKGYISAVHIFLDTLSKTGLGSVVSVSSITSQAPYLGSQHSILHYGAVKAAQEYAMKSFAKSYAHIPIRFNAIRPGWTDTPVLDSLGDFKKVLLDDASMRNPLLRVGTADEMGKTIAFLLSTEAAYITGVSIDVDGGQLLTNLLDGMLLGGLTEGAVEDAWTRWKPNKLFDLKTKTNRKAKKDL
eukprot:511727_1